MSSDFLISLRNNVGGTGVPGTGIGPTACMDVPVTAQDYDLRKSIPPDQWRHRVRAVSDKVLVFVHGFGDKAAKVLERHRAIKPYIPTDVVLVSFDWPAGNDIDPYKTDKANARAIAPRLLTDCLDLLLYGFDAQNIHLLAHSMGAFVTEAAFRVQSDTKINHVLMAAADVDQKNYAEKSPTLMNFLSKCTDLTAYWSTEDAALLDSVTINNYLPLGLRGYPDADVPTKRHGLQCTDYYNIYVKPTDKTPEFSHVWYLLFQPTAPAANDFYGDLKEILQGVPTLPTRALHYILKSKA